MDVAKSHAEKGLVQGLELEEGFQCKSVKSVREQPAGVSQVRAAVDRQMSGAAGSSQTAHGRFQKQPSRSDLPNSDSAKILESRTRS